MHVFFRDYRWKNGKPIGFGKSGQQEGIKYRIVADPYQKWITIEEYLDNEFSRIVYNSHLLDFRTLKVAESRSAWRRQELSKQEALIFNEDDRLILNEKYLFEDGVCRECSIFSPYGNLVGVQKMSYSSFGDPFNGVILYDALGKPVMYCKYRDCINGCFEELQEQMWDMEKSPHPNMMLAL